MVELTKCWNRISHGGKKEYGEKLHYYDPRSVFEGMEDCKITGPDGKEIDCTKIFFPGDRYITVKGKAIEVLGLIRVGNAAIQLLIDLYAAGYTIKQFMEQNERINLNA